MTDLRQALKSIQGFSSLSDAVLDQLLPFASLRTIRAGPDDFLSGRAIPLSFWNLFPEKWWFSTSPKGQPFSA